MRWGNRSEEDEKVIEKKNEGESENEGERMRWKRERNGGDGRESEGGYL